MGDPKTIQHQPQHQRIKLPAREKGVSNHFAYNAALPFTYCRLCVFVCVHALWLYHHSCYFTYYARILGDIFKTFEFPPKIAQSFKKICFADKSEKWILTNIHFWTMFCTPTASCYECFYWANCIQEVIGGRPCKMLLITKHIEITIMLYLKVNWLSEKGRSPFIGWVQNKHILVIEALVIWSIVLDWYAHTFNKLFCT